MKRVRTHNFIVVIGTDCPGSCKSNYQPITTTPIYNVTSVFDFVFIDIPVTSYFSLIFKDVNLIDGVMVSVLASTAVDSGFEP